MVRAADGRLSGLPGDRRDGGRVARGRRSRHTLAFRSLADPYGDGAGSRALWQGLWSVNGDDVDPVDLFRLVLQTRLDAAHQ
jgi:hypothetical protein